MKNTKLHGSWGLTFMREKEGDLKMMLTKNTERIWHHIPNGKESDFTIFAQYVITGWLNKETDEHILYFMK